jgi:hypothetical protein
MNKKPRQNLHEAKAEIDVLREQLGLAPIDDEKRSKTLHDAQQVLASLKAQSRCQDAETSATRTRSAFYAY